ncbi:MAG: T9SS type A sorting domain-containing protein [bacterium]|nr:T9SS type A sorting domain-containing protein [bacterium]
MTQSPGAPNSGEPCAPINAILEDVRENDDNGAPVLEGSFVIVRGIVNVNNGVMDDSTTNFFIQDDNAGVNIFGGNVPQGIMDGDCVEVSGWVDLFNGLTEIVSSGAGNCVYSVELLGSEGTYTPLVLTCASAFEAFEGMVAEIRNVTIVSGTWPSPGNNGTVTITDGAGTISLRIDRDTQVPTVPQPSGTFTVRGIITQFDENSPYDADYQITPRYTTDIITGSAAGDAPLEVAGSFILRESYPNPFNGVTNVEFEVGSAREITVSITDVLGREVYSNTLRNLTPGTQRLQWSPTGAAGLYFLRAQAGATIHTSKLLYIK